jgi:hypothetical protein
MWIHPRATNRFTLAHEFTHMMQNMAWIEYPGHGFINNDYVGSFWETHANFIALKDSPNQVESTDPARFLSQLSISTGARPGTTIQTGSSFSI